MIKIRHLGSIDKYRLSDGNLTMYLHPCDLEELKYELEGLNISKVGGNKIIKKELEAAYGGDLTTPKVKIVECKDGFLTVKISSPSFSKMSFCNKVKTLTRLTQLRAPHIWQEYTMIFSF